MNPSLQSLYTLSDPKENMREGNLLSYTIAYTDIYPRVSEKCTCTDWVHGIDWYHYTSQ